MLPKTTLLALAFSIIRCVPHIHKCGSKESIEHGSYVPRDSSLIKLKHDFEYDHEAVLDFRVIGFSSFATIGCRTQNEFCIKDPWSKFSMKRMGSVYKNDDKAKHSERPGGNKSQG
ncbi:hypothetical protein CDAR_271211 [Caerostris darwini]|uniref:Uncharacterized protein n=1 Tax=Caerostris darwini TaxID=1538125 RepID=A0AAV4TBT9_9ARAC|nr:hypothetical protein CDAR_271211 [Caerostris darwini]